MALQVTKEELVRVSALWGDMAFDALAYLEKTAEEVDRATKSGIRVSENLQAARKWARSNLDAALYAAPALKDAIKRTSF